MLSTADREWLWFELAHAVQHGMPLAKALKQLSDSNTGTRRGKAAGHLAEALANGHSLSDAARACPHYLTPEEAAALEAGERSGQLADVLRLLSDDAREAATFRSGIASAVTYPVLISLAALGVVTFILMYITPMFNHMFDELDIQVAPLTIYGPAFVRIEAFALLFLPALALTGLYLVPAQCLPLRRWLDVLRLECPLVGGVLRRQTLARWCAATGMLLRAGVTESTALRLAGKSCGNRAVAVQSDRLSQSVEAGETLSESMTASWFFPAALTWMVRAGDEAGGHAHVWHVAADLYRRQAQTAARVVAVLLGVFFMLLMSQVVGVVVISVFMPLFSLLRSLGG